MVSEITLCIVIIREQSLYTFNEIHSPFFWIRGRENILLSATFWQVPQKVAKTLWVTGNPINLRSCSLLPHPPLQWNDCSHSKFTLSQPLCGWFRIKLKREVPNVGGIAAVIMRSFGIAETTSFFRIAAPSFYRLSRQSVVNPFPPCHKWQGDRNTALQAKPYGLFYFPFFPFPCFLPPLVCFSIAPSETLCFWTANLCRWMDMKEFRSSPFVLKKITPDGFAVPNIFCRPKLF